VDRIEGDWVESKEITRLQADVALLQWQRLTAKGEFWLYAFSSLKPFLLYVPEHRAACEGQS